MMAKIELSDGTIVDYLQFLNDLKNPKKQKPAARPMVITSGDGVKIKVGNLEMRQRRDVEPEIENIIESKKLYGCCGGGCHDYDPNDPPHSAVSADYRRWKISVWTRGDKHYCQYSRNGVRHNFNVDVSDDGENAVFAEAERRVDKIADA